MQHLVELLRVERRVGVGHLADTGSTEDGVPRVDVEQAVDLTLLVILEKWAPGFGIGPLVALFNPEHLGKDFSGYPVGYPVDLVLVLALVASTIYDAVDSWRAAARFNEKLD